MDEWKIPLKWMIWGYPHLWKPPFFDSRSIPKCCALNFSLNGLCTGAPVVIFKTTLGDAESDAIHWFFLSHTDSLISVILENFGRISSYLSNSKWSKLEFIGNFIRISLEICWDLCHSVNLQAHWYPGPVECPALGRYAPQWGHLSGSTMEVSNWGHPKNIQNGWFISWKIRNKNGWWLGVAPWLRKPPILIVVMFVIGCN